MKVQFGIDHFLQQNKFKDLRFALVTNNAATTSSGESSRVALVKAGFNIIKLFSPEHGLTTQGEDGAYQKNIIDPITNLPVISLYGDNLEPTENDLSDIDAIVYDIPDIGCRFYTYLWTMSYVMEACATFKKQFIILDRPNPISGNLNLAEGPMLDEENCSSFIGRWDIPIRHSSTLGELANYFASTRINDLDLQIIKTQNWKREQSAKEAEWYFIPPSPAITDIEIALLYPGMGLLEGINVNEGRGTKTPFKIFGAPWINASQLQKAFLSLQLPGIGCESFVYTPTVGLYANEHCNGLKLFVTDIFSFRPVQTGLKLIHLITSLYTDHCQERLYSTRANRTGKGHLDKLTGVYHSFKKIKNGVLPETGLADSTWKELIQPFLLY
jgi:uncharacterized protein YbbC (DUF1343 family)